MKKYIVRWKPKKGGKVLFRQEVTAPDTLTAQAMVGVPAQGEVVSVEEYVTDLWTPLVKSGAAGALMEHLRAADDAYLDRMHRENRPVRD